MEDADAIGIELEDVMQARGEALMLAKSLDGLQTKGERVGVPRDQPAAERLRPEPLRHVVRHVKMHAPRASGWHRRRHGRHAASSATALSS